MTRTPTDLYEEGVLVVDIDESDDPPTFHEILLFMQDVGLVGEEDTVLTVVVGTVHGGLILLYGISRGGKDAVIEAAIQAFPPDLVYEWSTGDDSDTAAYYDAATLNSYPVHYMGDLARMNEVKEKTLKPWGEGKPAVRRKTNIAIDDVDEQVLNVPRTVLLTAAIDNRNFDLNDYPEVQKRALMKGVDGTKAQTEAIMERKALEAMDQVETQVEPGRRAAIREHMGGIPVDEFVDHPNNKIVNPMGLAMVQQHVLPSEFVEARQDIERLMEYIGAVTLINHPKRLTVDTGRGLRMLVAPVDVWYGMQIFGNNMVMSTLNLTNEDQAVLRFLREVDYTPSVRDVHEGLQRAGYAVMEQDVRRSLKSMVERGYVSEHDGSPLTYSLSDFHSITQHKIGLDFGELVEIAKREIRNTKIPEAVQDLYIERFCEGEGLMAVHPYTGETVNIIEDRSLQDVIDEATADVGDVLGDPFEKYRADDEPAAESSPAAEAEVEADGGDTQARLV